MIRRAILVGVLSAAISMAAAGQGGGCKGSSAPARLACTAAEVVAPAARQTDDAIVRGTTRLSKTATENIGARATLESAPQAVTRQRTELLRAAQDASKRAAADAAVHTAPEVAIAVPVRTEKEAIKKTLAQSQAATQAAKRLAPPQSANVAKSPNAAAAQLQALKAANTAKLTPAARNSLGATIATAEKAVTAAKKQASATINAVVGTPLSPKAPSLAGAKVVDNAMLAGKRAATLAPKLPAGAAASARLRPGMATYNVKLPIVSDPNWLSGRTSVPVPGQIAARLAGRNFRNFNHFRASVWREIGTDRVLSKNFKANDISRMRSGRAPEAPQKQRRGKRVGYELDHMTELQDGGSVYDLSNLRIKSPDAHVRKIARKFSVASDGR